MIALWARLQFIGEVTAIGDTVWGGGFGAEFFVCDREAYLYTSEGAKRKKQAKIQ